MNPPSIMTDAPAGGGAPRRGAASANSGDEFRSALDTQMKTESGRPGSQAEKQDAEPASASGSVDSANPGADANPAPETAAGAGNEAPLELPVFALPLMEPASEPGTDSRGGAGVAALVTSPAQSVSVLAAAPETPLEGAAAAPSATRLPAAPPVASAAAEPGAQAAAEDALMPAAGRGAPGAEAGRAGGGSGAGSFDTAGAEARAASRPGAGDSGTGFAQALSAAAPARSTLAADAALPRALPALDAALGSPQWGQGLGSRIAFGIAAGLTSATLEVNPPQLGPVNIQLSVVDDEASVQFTAQHAPVREAIEFAMPRLREALAEEGIRLGDVSVGGGVAHGDSQAERDRNAGSGQRHGAAEADDLITDTVSVRLSEGLVDTFA